MLAFILVLFVALLFLGVPILVALGIPALVYTALKGLPISIVSYSMFQSLNSFPLLASPLYILMGNLVNEFGETECLFNFTRVLLRNTRGYTAKVNIVASLIFAGISGAAVADIGGLGPIEIRAMENEGFKKDYAAALTAATSVVGPIFPPSIPLIIYAVAAQVSTLSALMAGVLPALIITVVMFIFVSADLPRRLPVGAVDTNVVRQNDSLLKATRDALHILVLVPGVVASMLFGVFTPSEAGAAAIIYIIAIEILRGKFSLAKVKSAMLASYKMTASIFAIIAVAALFTKVLTLEHFPEMVTKFFLSASTSKFVILLLVNILLLVVGMFMETVSSLLILTPILLQVTKAIGVDPIHLGIIIVYNLTLGLLTPPFGVGVFTCATVSKLPPERIFREVVPLYIPLAIALLVITYVPELSLWLPRLIK